MFRGILLVLILTQSCWAQYSSRVLAVETRSAAQVNVEAIRAKGIKVSGTVFQVIPNTGILFKGMALIPAKIEKSIPDSSLLHPGKTKTIVVDGEKPVPLGAPGDDIIFIICSTQTLVDGSPVRGMIYPCGTYTYETPSGTSKTVWRFSDTPESAYTWLVSGN